MTGRLNCAAGAMDRPRFMLPRAARSTSEDATPDLRLASG